MKTIKNRNYCFTSFKEKLTPDMGQCKYVIFGIEICPKTNKRHLQGYIELFNPCRIKKVQQLLGDNVAHIEIRRGTRDEARSYCMKDEKYEEFGKWNTVGQGRRQDLIDLVSKIENGASDYELLKENPEQVFSYEKFIKNTRNILKQQKFENYKKEFTENFKPNDIQSKIITQLEKQNERQITWVYDPIGNTGKTWLSKFLVGQGGIRFTNGKNTDISYAYNGEDICVFDFSRSLEDRINYDIIEQLKNGMVFSNKYESKCKMFKPPKILCLSNFYPNLEKLSKDRWDIVDLTAGGQPGNTNRLCYTEEKEFEFINSDNDEIEINDILNKYN